MMEAEGENLPFISPWIGGNEITYLKEVFENGNFVGNGDFSKRCQRLMEEKIGIRYVGLTTSCAAALDLAAMSSEVGFVDKVIVPSPLQLLPQPSK